MLQLSQKQAASIVYGFLSLIPSVTTQTKILPVGDANFTGLIAERNYWRRKPRLLKPSRTN
jgi:hypothetical protein